LSIRLKKNLYALEKYAIQVKIEIYENYQLRESEINKIYRDREGGNNCWNEELF